ncbi:hypothetical protein BGX34_010785 [Mortierella sp. NVP85]|nr:hypothetical protein BGX34_010785 [Mortierella sp. NVP85]
MSQLTPSKVGNLEILIAQEPGKSISVQYKIHEPIFFLIQRISIKLGGKNDSKAQEGRLYMNGVLLKNPQESLARYHIYGNTLTYKAEKRIQIFIHFFAGTVAFCCNTGTTVMSSST